MDCFPWNWKRHAVPFMSRAFGEDEDRLHGNSIKMEPKDGLISAYEFGHEYTPAFTDCGMKTLAVGRNPQTGCDL